MNCVAENNPHLSSGNAGQPHLVLYLVYPKTIVQKPTTLNSFLEPVAGLGWDGETLPDLSDQRYTQVLESVFVLCVVCVYSVFQTYFKDVFRTGRRFFSHILRPSLVKHTANILLGGISHHLHYISKKQVPSSTPGPKIIQYKTRILLELFIISRCSHTVKYKEIAKSNLISFNRFKNNTQLRTKVKGKGAIGECSYTRAMTRTWVEHTLFPVRRSCVSVPTCNSHGTL